MTQRHASEQPSRNEDEYFARQDAELIKEMRSRLDRERSAQERKAHYMKCPKDGADLKEESHGPAKVDVCPECGGMWLDAGEMELMQKVHKAGGQNLFKGILDLFPGRSSSRK
ncbi:MAG TPA: zf-TFIIB domain-containing protein [Gemmatimonadaceae bacterium]|nr:zf-TFIIB domain-containing protein [Gemmatimonadaceae bacterium]